MRWWNGPFSTLRALAAAAVADSAPAAAAAWVDLGDFGRNTIEVRYAAGALGGTVAPDSVTIAIWRKVVEPDGTVVIDRIHTRTIEAADIAKPLPDVIDAYGSLFYATLESFTGGTAPTVTLSVQARFVEIEQ